MTTTVSKPRFAEGKKCFLKSKNHCFHIKSKLGFWAQNSTKQARVCHRQGTLKLLLTWSLGCVIFIRAQHLREEREEAELGGVKGLEVRDRSHEALAKPVGSSAVNCVCQAKTAGRLHPALLRRGLRSGAWYQARHLCSSGSPWRPLLTAPQGLVQVFPWGESGGHTCSAAQWLSNLGENQKKRWRRAKCEICVSLGSSKSQHSSRSLATCS